MSRNDEHDPYDDRQEAQQQRASSAMVPCGPGDTGTVARRGFGTEEIEVRGETAGTILAAQAKAMVEARFIVAMQRPRDWDDVRVKLLKACERAGFATGYLDPGQRDWKKAVGAAWYNKPVGEGVQGFSIRFAEEAMRAMGNLDVNTITLYDDEMKRILSVVVTDLENNVALPTSILVEKTVERRKLGRGAEFIRTRVNSFGDTLYIIPATEDEVFQKQQSLSSKAIRNAILRLLPGDIAAECRQRILEIRQGDIAKDPDKARKGVTDAFATLNVLPSGLKEYLGHDLGTATPAEIQELRDLYAAIKDGTATWVDALEEALEARGEGTKSENEGEQGKAANGAPSTKLKESLRSKREAASKSKQSETAGPAASSKQTATAPTQEEDVKQQEEKTEEREPGDEKESELSAEDEKRADIVDLIIKLGDIKQRNVAADVIELYGETRLLQSRSDEKTVALIPDENLSDVLKQLEKKLAEFTKKK